MRKKVNFLRSVMRESWRCHSHALLIEENWLSCACMILKSENPLLRTLAYLNYNQFVTTLGSKYDALDTAMQTFLLYVCSPKRVFELPVNVNTRPIVSATYASYAPLIRSRRIWLYKICFDWLIVKNSGRSVRGRRDWVGFRTASQNVPWHTPPLVPRKLRLWERMSS